MKLRPRTDEERRYYLIEYLVDIAFCIGVVLFADHVVHAPHWGGWVVAWLTFQIVRTRAVLTDRLARHG